MTQSKVGWRLEHHFYPQIVSVDVLYLLVAVWCWCKSVTAVEDVRHQAELIEVTMESSGGALHKPSHSHSPLSYSAHIRTFDFHLAAFSQPNSYIKEVELLNNFVWSMVHQFFISAARKILGWYGEWFSAAVGKYEHATVHCRDLLMERDRWHGTPCICKL